MNNKNDGYSHKRKALPARGRADILDKLRGLLPELYAAEKRAALLILSEPAWVSEHSIKSFASRTEVSEPTVMRLSRKLELEGFTALKKKLTEDLIIAQMYLESNQASQDLLPSTMADELLNSATKAMQVVVGQLDVDLLSRATALLADANMVYCFGVGGSSAIFAEEAVNRLFRLGINAHAVSDPYRQRMVASIAHDRDVFLCISSTGLPSSVVDSAALAHSNGAEVISITSLGSPLAEQSTEVIAVEIFDDEIFFNLPSRTRYAQLFALDCLVATLAARLPQSAENLKSIRATLGALHGITKYQPIGD